MDAPINPHRLENMAAHQKLVDYKHNNREVPEGVSFAKDVFQKGADFRNTTFTNFIDFSGATFLGEVDFSGAVFLHGASFEGAQFGLPYNRKFGDWEIRFVKSADKYELYRRKKDEKGKTAWEKIGEIDNDTFVELLNSRGMGEFSQGISESFETFRKNPETVSFKNCCFGDKDKTSEKHGGSDEENVIFQNAGFHNRGNVSFYSAQFSNEGRVTFASAQFSNKKWVNFGFAKFSNKKWVTFESVRFNNEGDVDFKSARFSNKKWVNFRSTRFSNEGNVDFESAQFDNEGWVAFEYAQFSNEAWVTFNSAQFSNKKWVNFRSTRFSNKGRVNFERTQFDNDGMVSFSSAQFSNNGGVYFCHTKFGNDGLVTFEFAQLSNGGPVEFNKVVWLQYGNLHLISMKFKDDLDMKFMECLFLCHRNVSFAGTRFPGEGSVMFQRCYFAGMNTVDFTGVYFRHTVFEGGPIEWLKKGDGDLKSALEDKYGKLPETVEKRIDELDEIPEFPHVFAKDVKVLWKDLTTESAKNLTFRLTGFYKSVFDGVTLSHIQLNAPEWQKNAEGRNILYKEVENQKPSIDQLRNLEDQYTQLKNNLERQGNYLHGGHFHYGEQEIRRKILAKEGRGKSLLYRLSTLYKFSSSYGERPGRAGAVFLFGLLLASLVLAAISADYSGIAEMGTWQILGAGLAKWFGSGVEIVTPFSWRHTMDGINASNWYIYLILVVSQALLLAIQLPILILAVRRRFKR